MFHADPSHHEQGDAEGLHWSGLCRDVLSIRQILAVEEQSNSFCDRFLNRGIDHDEVSGLLLMAAASMSGAL